MASQRSPDYEDDNPFELRHQSSCQEFEDQDDDGFESDSKLSDGDDTLPIHPVSALQQAFEESIVEAAEDVQYETTPRSATHPSAESRRKALLAQITYDDSWNTRWKQKPSAQCHPLAKLIAQIIFGMHLLHNHQARSDAEVVKILQAHVDDIDGFLEKTTDDFDLAINDIEERLVFLQLPMTHVDVFNIMLEDWTFRTQLVEGNDKIELIIERTAKAMNAALSDVQQGIDAIQELARYLDKVGHDWPEDYSELPAILTAMRGNQEGWLCCFRELQMSGNRLAVVLVQLGTTIGEMSRLAAAASRRTMAQDSFNQNVSVLAPRSKYASGGSRAHQSRQSKHMSQQSLDKPLPQEPDPLHPAVHATLPRSPIHHHHSIEERLDRSPGRLETLASQSSGGRRKEQSTLQPREPQSPRTAETSVLATFIRHTGPLDSHTRTPTDSENLVAPSPPTTTNESVYLTGSDPAIERQARKRMTVPQRFGLFPDSKPPTPESLSRPPTRAATGPTTPVMASPPLILSYSAATTKSGHFSLRRIFHRKSRIQEVN